MNTDQIIVKLTEILVEYGPKLIGAIVVLIVGTWVIKLLVKGFTRLMEKSNVDNTIRPFFRTLVHALLRVLLVLSVLGMLGIEMTSFIAILGAVGLAIGMALSGTLQNFAGGVIILIFKPYKVGDVIEAQGYKGVVTAIQIFNTILRTPNNRTVIIPNGQMSTSSMVNNTMEEDMCVEWIFSISYGDSYPKAKEVIKHLLENDSRIQKDKDIFIALLAMADSSINIVARAWVHNSDYWGVFFSMNELVYEAFPKEGLTIPFPQMDVHVHKP
ncbi:MAG: mechanosensitive ion channel [Bacteroidetes bacterium]|nr:mechanosensitive ion channel [Bacteroidota bacterium]